MSTVHLICGPTGAGKTTYAKKLAAQKGAVRFSIDEWMANLFAADTPDPLTFDWAWARVQRCQTQLWQNSMQLLALGTGVVLDLGFTTREHRDDFRRRAAEAGAEVALHHVTADSETRRKRVSQRNKDRSETFAFEITDGMFAFMEDRFEIPAEDEAAVIVRT